MLAKQGWRLLNETNSLVSEIMKAKYYPGTSLLNAELGKNPSYVQRSIMTAMDVVKASTRRKIGNGLSTKVWSVPWLPSVKNGYLTTVMPDQLSDILVNSFMNSEEHGWDIEVVNDVCNSRDVELIKRIPIPMINKEDSWFWQFDERGEFTVKSSYRWFQGEGDNTHRVFWNKLWSLKLPCKVTNFLWRVSRGYLPTASVLAMKGINVSTRCPWCHSAVETDEHVIFACDFAKTVWCTVGLHQFVHLVQHDIAFMVLLAAFEVCTREQCVQIGMISWSIWNRRSKWCWEKINGSIYGVKAATANLIRDWREAQDSVMVRRMQGEQGDRIWKKSEEWWLKINTDAAVFQDGSIGVGNVIRDSQGCFIEAISMKEALSWVIKGEYKQCVFETDSKCLLTACNGSPGEAFFGTLVLDCVHLLKHINHVLVKFVFRSAKTVAHKLAKAAYSMSDTGPPNFISHVLVVDNS